MRKVNFITEKERQYPMRKNIVLTLTGPDRIGIVDTVTELLLQHGGNVETSRMARLGGEFAILMLVSIPIEQLDGLDQQMETLRTQGYQVTTTPTERTFAETHPGWQPYQIQVFGADHQGIIHEIAHYLSHHSINVESMDTETTRAPLSGAPLFTMNALVLVPPDLQTPSWETALEDMGHRLNVDIQVDAVSTQ